MIKLEQQGLVDSVIQTSKTKFNLRFDYIFLKLGRALV